MEHEANLLERIADIFDAKVEKRAPIGKCDRCGQMVSAGNDIYCQPCAILALRDLARHLRNYL